MGVCVALVVLGIGCGGPRGPLGGDRGCPWWCAVGVGATEDRVALAGSSSNPVLKIKYRSWARGLGRIPITKEPNELRDCAFAVGLKYAPCTEII